MQRPPPVSQIGRYPVTGGICLLASVVMIAGTRVDLSPLYVNYLAFRGEPWRLLTTVLPHANVFHLAGNLYWVWLFGSLIEGEFGSIRTVLLMLVLAIGSNAAEYAFGIGGIGLSGVGYGLFGFLWVGSRTGSRLRDAMDARTANFFIVWFFFCIFTTWTGVWLIANVAHGSGALFGAIAGCVLVSHRLVKIAAVAALVISTSLTLCAASIWRPLVNFSADAPLDLERDGVAAIEKGDNQQAVSLLQAATKYRGAKARTWYNLGVAHERLNQMPQTTEAFEKSIALDPSDVDDQGNALNFLAYGAAVAGNHKRAADLYQRAVKAGCDNTATWSALGIELQRIGRTKDAAEAFRHAATTTPSPTDGDGSETQPASNR